MSPEKRKTSLFARLIVVVLALLLAISLGELVLRVIYPTLPSLAALLDSSFKLKKFNWDGHPGAQVAQASDLQCVPASYLHNPNQKPSVIVGKGPGEPHNLWVTGDSVAKGFGVAQKDGVAERLGRRLSDHLGARVQVRNLAINGAGFCLYMSHLLSRMEEGPAPDALVLLLFADDLEHRAMMAVGDSVVAFPDRIQSPTGRALVENSYLANLTWMVSLMANQDKVPQRFIGTRGRKIFVGTMKLLVQQVQLARIPLITALVAPTGLHLCPENPPPASRCRWLGQDMALMAALLTEAGVPFLDLRELWKGKDEGLILADELERMRNSPEIAVHPSAAGHKLLAEKIWASLVQAFPGGKTR